MMTAFWEFIDRYSSISEESKKLWSVLLKTSSIVKGNHFLDQGVIPKDIAFVRKGLLSYYYLNEKGEKIIKRFFPEDSLVASTSALLKQEPGSFSIEALEDTELISYSFSDFRNLTIKYNDIANFYITYLERHWVVEKEFSEITLKSATAKQRYLEFEKNYPQLISRLKLNQVASYLAVTPTQLSRIRAEL
ncbi:Crp/Fnr family transcriptional regulator [Chryseobacterium sp. SSA4.19]|uniref:Crp/Fnr family transcriptional regulator n=1 Tax=Chryseobacterium sp. SSA4.19 TaxID=2919915 RepID=UPI001F4D4E1C|nr:Crp/Fnr family transcriptional regulator [Chryseobacterium sp. SSA4.19]MCJ8154699.1 Crp/Fnr family transcriptional regulator [Chryseobacterium sp. SSA4.19]